MISQVLRNTYLNKELETMQFYIFSIDSGQLNKNKFNFNKT